MKVRVASAGTGKTTSLVKRYLELVDAGVPLGRVAGVTFTRAAADELRQRVASGIEEVLERGSFLGSYYAPAGDRALFERAHNELEGAVLSTIHGFMIAGLRLNAPNLGLDPDFALLGEWEAAALFEEECAGLLMLAEKRGHPLHEAAAVLGGAAAELLLQLFTKRSLGPELVFGSSPTEAALEAMYRAALARYDARLGATSLAPGEVERRALKMLDRQLATSRLIERFPHVLVDEYQDVNPLQGAFFERLAAAGARLELVGDPKQSIYGFRNADVAVFRRALDAAELAGDLQPPLRESRRHARAPVAFLNRLTAKLAEQDLGFSPREAPSVTGAGDQADVLGSVELVVIEGGERLDVLRDREAEVLAERLEAHVRRGVAYEEMAVLARSHGALTRVAAALRGRGVPAFVVQGRGYYERSEVRDLRHALAVGAGPLGAGLLPFLRGPFAGLTLPEMAELARLDPSEWLTRLIERFPAVAGRMALLARLARATPLEALKGILREPLLGGKRFQELLTRRGRENVDALLFEVAGQPPRDVALFLDRLDLLARQAEAGDVPQGGEGVRLLSIHASKGLEFRVVGLFDAGAWGSNRHSTLLVEPGSGAVRLAGSPDFEQAQQEARLRDEQESFRLLYVAASRARDALVLTASMGRRPGVWLATLLELGLEGAGALPGVTLERLPYSPPEVLMAGEPEVPVGALPPAPWLDARREKSALPPVVSPSALARLRATDATETGEATEVTGVTDGDGTDRVDRPDMEYEADEPLSPAERSAGEDELERGRVGWGRARGTLTHFAIGHDWRPDDPSTRSTLLAQEVLAPFDRAQQAELVEEVLELLGHYWGMLGQALPALGDRGVDRAELPLAVSLGGTVWEGVVDRLYEVDGEWYLDDYKTDKLLAPERYYVQLGHYLNATERALGVRPRGRLVFLRHGRLIEPRTHDLADALERAGLGGPG